MSARCSLVRGFQTRTRLEKVAHETHRTYGMFNLFEAWQKETPMGSYAQEPVPSKLASYSI